MSAIRGGSTQISGRYDGSSRNTRPPPGGLQRPAPSHNVRTAVVAVEDPWGDTKKGERVLAHVNRNTDVLELERSHHRISEAAYLTGRIIMVVFEKTGRVGGSNWAGASRVDAEVARECRIIGAILDAERAEQLVGRMQRAIGIVGTRFLRSIITEGATFASAATARGQTGDRAVAYAGVRFRGLLEDLAEEWQARGKSAAKIVAAVIGDPTAAAIEEPKREPRPPIVADRSEITAGLGRSALRARAGEKASAEDRAAVVRAGLRKQR